MIAHKEIKMVNGSLLSTRTDTDSFQAIERPKSPLKMMPVIHLVYLTMKGCPYPYWTFKDSIRASSTFSPRICNWLMYWERKSPGGRSMMANETKEMIKTEAIINKKRFRRYLPTMPPTFLIGIGLYIKIWMSFLNSIPAKFIAQSRNTPHPF